jgi:methyl-accepting chemotaxis protein PixJ
MTTIDNSQNLISHNLEMTTEIKPNNHNLVQKIKTSLYKQERTRAWNIIQRMRQEKDFTRLLNKVVAMIRQELKANRVLVYQFNNDISGLAIAESLASQQESVLNQIIPCAYFGQATASDYRKENFFIVETDLDRDATEQDSKEAQMAEASLIMPILANSHASSPVWGLLVLQQDHTRQWQEEEINLLDRITVEITLALQTARPFVAFGQQYDLSSKVNQDIQQAIKEQLQYLKQTLSVERALVYGYHPDGSGKVIAEVVDSQWKPAGSTLEKDYVLLDNYQPYYVVDDVSTKEFSRCFQEQLDALEIKAYITVPIVQNKKLIGILSVFQHSHPRNWQESEVKLIQDSAINFSIPLQQTALMRHAQFQIQQKNKALALEKGLTKMLEQIRSTQDKEAVWQITTQEGRKLLGADRLAIYRFDPDWSGKFIAESVAGGWSKLIDTMLVLQDTHLQETQGGRYKHGECFAVEDIYTSGHQDCHIELLEQFEARAYAIAPIFGANKKLWGLVGVYHNQGSHKWQTEEIAALRQMGLQIGIAMEQIEYIQKIKEKAQQEAVINQISVKIRESSDVEEIFKSITQELRQAVSGDRAVIYQFNPDWSGQVIAESVAAGWVSLLVEQQDDAVLTGNRLGSDRCAIRKWSGGDITITDTHLQETKGGIYSAGVRFTAINDIYTHGFSACYVESLEKYEAKAYIIAPIFNKNQLWGLVGVYQNSGSRYWQKSETNLMVQISEQLSLALQQTELLKSIQKRNEELAISSERESAIINFSSQLVSRLASLSQINFDSDILLGSILKELRQVLKTDRVGIYQFNPDWSGQFTLESVDIKWNPLVGTHLAQVDDTYLKDQKGGRYAKRESLIVNDLYLADHSPCHVGLLEAWGTKAYIIAPIFREDKLWGLLGVYQNDGPREWKPSEITIVKQVGTQIGVILQLGNYVTQLRSQEQQLITAAEQEKAKREQFQHGALRVLRALQPSFQGDLTVRAPLSEDEIGTIADGYNTTIQSLRELVRQVQISSSRVRDTSGSNTSFVNELSNQAQQQVSRLGTAFSELQLMIQCTQDVTFNAEKVEQAVQEANRTVQQGDALMEQTVDSILEVRDTVSETAKKIKRLGEASQKISKVVNLIDNFATQTNLLSLNAAIEATRAGEYGKGFAVVADEVRILAYQSANATTEIEKLVEEIQAEINEVTVVMEVGISQVVQGSELVDETRQSLNEIVAVTNEISSLVEGITEAARIQSQQSQTLSEAMTDVSTLANQTFANSNQISQSFQELLSTSEELQTSVSRFKVD